MNQMKNNGTANVSNYWNDKSYISVTEGNAEKIFYYNGDHSAIQSAVAGKYDSKWGQLPLMRHAPTYGPIMYKMNYRQYFRRIYITGSSLARLSGTTYTLNNAGNPGNVTWSCSSNLQITSSNKTSAIVKSNANGSGWLRATVDGQPVKDYLVWAGKPVISSVEGERRVPNGQYARFVAKYDWNSSPTSFQWILNPQNGNVLYGANSAFLDIAFYNAGSYQLVVRATNANGTGEYYTTGVNVYDANSYSYQVYPSPASDVVIINFDSKSSEEDSFTFAKTDQGKLYKVYLYSDKGNIVRQTTSDGSQIQFTVSNLPNGMYYLHIDNGSGETPEIQKVIVKH